MRRWWRIPIIADFYADMQRWAFHSQIFFLTRRLHAHHQLLMRSGVVVQDRSVYEDAEIFAAQPVFERADEPSATMRPISDLYEVLKLFLPPPHLVIYLQSSVETLLKRIALRGREYENKYRTLVSWTI